LRWTSVILEHASTSDRLVHRALCHILVQIFIRDAEGVPLGEVFLPYVASGVYGEGNIAGHLIATDVHLVALDSIVRLKPYRLAPTVLKQLRSSFIAQVGPPRCRNTSRYSEPFMPGMMISGKLATCRYFSPASSLNLIDFRFIRSSPWIHPAFIFW
jgi:hypothetical protein